MSAFFEPLLDYLDEPHTHLRSIEASRILENLSTAATQWRGPRIAHPADDEDRTPLTDPIELVEAMTVCGPALDVQLLDELLLHTISQ